MIIRSCRVDSEVSASLKVLVNMMTRVVTSSYTTCRQVYRSKSLLFQHLFIASVTPGRIPLESCKFQALAFQDRTCKFFFVYFPEAHEPPLSFQEGRFDLILKNVLYHTNKYEMKNDKLYSK